MSKGNKEPSKIPWLLITQITRQKSLLDWWLCGPSVPWNYFWPSPAAALLIYPNPSSKASHVLWHDTPDTKGKRLQHNLSATCSDWAKLTEHCCDLCDRKAGLAQTRKTWLWGWGERQHTQAHPWQVAGTFKLSAENKTFMNTYRQEKL